MTTSSPGQQAEPGNDDVPHEHRHPLDAFVSDPSDIAPMCDEPLFTEIMKDMVADEPPHLFPIVQEYGERVDCRIVAWGMAFTDHVEVVSVDRGLRMSLRTPESALPGFRFGTHIRAHLMWLTPDAVTPAEERHGESLTST